MDTVKEKKQDTRIGIIAFTISFVLFVGCLGAFIYQKHTSNFLGHKIVYQADYKTAQFIQAVGPNRVMFSECVEEPTNIKITEDTVVFTTSKASLGLKPLSKVDTMNITCRREDGAIVTLKRIPAPPKSEYTTDEVFLIIQPEGAVMLTKEDKCIPLGEN